MSDAWQSINWNFFPLQVTIEGKTWTIGDYMEFDRQFEHPDENDALSSALYDAFKWYGLGGRGQYISIGRYFGYPKCCIYSFAFDWADLIPSYRDSTRRALVDHYHALGDTTGKMWILCRRCADDCKHYGIEKYLTDFVPNRL